MSKQLGDAGEWYALSQFGFCGIAAAKMPDNWTAYDLILDFNGRLFKVSVKTRTKTEKWASAPWFNFDSTKVCDILVLVLRDGAETRSWVLPYRLAVEKSRRASPASKIAGSCDLYLSVLEAECSPYLDFWELPVREVERFIAIPSDLDGPTYSELINRVAAELAKRRAP